jgi:hypothetical protein
MMKIHVYSVMHNEAEILPYFLRHYGSFAERIFVWEDQSTDGTRQLLEAQSKVSVFNCEQHGIQDIWWVQALWPQYETLSRDADWIIVVDADEFVYHPQLLEVLQREKEAGTQLIHAQGFTMLADKTPTTNGQIYDEIQRGVPDRWSGKWIVHSPDIHIRFQSGRHGKPKYEAGVKARAHTGIRILHYRWLGPQYFQQRDVRNADRLSVATGKAIQYSPKTRHNLPDSSRGVPLEWYPGQQGINCVEDV